MALLTLLLLHHSAAFAFLVPASSSSSAASIPLRSQGPWGSLGFSLREGRHPHANGQKNASQRGPLRALLSSPAQEKLAMVGDGKERSGEYFVAEIGGSQRWMERGRFYDVNRIHQKEGGQMMLLRVLMLQQKEGPLLVGQPFLENIRVRH